MQIEMLYCFKSRKDLFSKHSVAKRTMCCVACSEANMLVIGSEDHGGKDGPKQSPFFKRVMLHIRGNFDGPQISRVLR